MNPSSWEEIMSDTFLEQMGFKFIADLLTEIRNGQMRLEEIMADLQTEVAELRDAVSGVSARVDALVGPLTDAVREAQDALAAEREAAANLAAAEDAEDVEQNRQLEEARAATDTALANAQQAADEISAETDRLNAVAQPANPEQPEEPTA
jgi:peptidoglycan hydrolase CwlO-like protein